MSIPLSAGRKVAQTTSRSGSAVFKSLLVTAFVTHYYVTNTPRLWKLGIAIIYLFTYFSAEN